MKPATWCAVFALAVQLILSFGHFHRNGIGSEPVSPLRAVSSTDHAIPATDAGGPPSKPAVPVIDYCAICAVINLAGSIVPPTTPAISLPAVVGRVLAWSAAKDSLTAPPYLYPRARAPPRAQAIAA